MDVLKDLGIAEEFPASENLNDDLDQGSEASEASASEDNSASSEQETSDNEQPVDDSEGQGEEASVEVSDESPAEGQSADASASDSTNALRAEIERLRGLVEEAHAKKLLQQNAPSPASQPEAQQPPAQHPEVLHFLTDDSMLEEALTSKDALNKLLTSVYRQAMSDSVQQMALSLPNIVAAQVQQQASLKQHVDGFYAQNPHLVGVKRTVASVATEISAEHPDWNVEQVFSEAARKTTELLGLQSAVAQQTSQVSNSKPLKSPALVNQKGGRKAPGNAVSKQQLEIEELLKGV